MKTNSKELNKSKRRALMTVRVLLIMALLNAMAAVASAGIGAIGSIATAIAGEFNSDYGVLAVGGSYTFLMGWGLFSILASIVASGADLE